MFYVFFSNFTVLTVSLQTLSMQMCSLTVDMMKEKGLTEGAAKKLHKKLEELRFVILTVLCACKWYMYILVNIYD